VKPIEVTFLRDNAARDEARYKVTVAAKHTIEVNISQTQKASGPPSPEYRIKEKTREWILNGTLPPHGAVVRIDEGIDPRYF